MAASSTDAVALPDAVRDRLLAALGTKGLCFDPDRIEPKLVDWRGRFHGETPALLLPATTEEAAAAVAICAEARIAITPQGGNTGLVGGGTPQGEVLVSLERMRGVRDVDPANDSLTVEAGVALETVQTLAAEAGKLFPLALGSQGAATIGGLVSTNAGGVAVLRYGMMRDLVLGLEVVTADGRVWNGLKALRKDNTGYDLKQLFIGAEGTLGVVTAATLKLFAKPAARAVALCGLATPNQAVALLAECKRAAGDTVTAFELIPAFGLDLVLKHIPDTRAPLADRHEWLALVEMSFAEERAAQATLERALGNALESGLIADAAVAANESQAEAFWKLRETLPEAEKAHGPALKHDVSVPVSAMPTLITEASAAAQARLPDAPIIAFGHVGDGNIHFNVAKPEAMARETFLGFQDVVAAAVYDVVDRLGGSISAEHGIGVLKSEALARRIQPVERDMMLAVKRALDPHGLMNPRVLLPEGPAQPTRAAE